MLGVIRRLGFVPLVYRNRFSRDMRLRFSLAAENDRLTCGSTISNRLDNAIMTVALIVIFLKTMRFRAGYARRSM
jgi:hypothetical protein